MNPIIPTRYFIGGINRKSVTLLLLTVVVLFLFQIAMSAEIEESGYAQQTCLTQTANEGQCKDCCDCMSGDADAIKSCRDSCAVQDFSQNTNLLSINAPSVLGPNGDYSLFLSSDEQACKLACDNSDALACGDRRYCRDACANGASSSVEQLLPDGVVGNPDSPPASGSGQEMNMEQTLSDQAQLMTIAFDGLAFLSGDMCSDTFLPPGKVADFSGFQYLRDNDPTGLGHNTDFVTIIAFNILNLLTDEQMAKLVDLAKSQIDMINQYGYQRFPLIQAFRRQLEGDIPEGSHGLSQSAVMEYSAELYRLDGLISYERAETLGYILRHLNSQQQSALDALKALNGVGNWDANVEDPLRILYPDLSHDEHVAVMTYASEMYSWYAGSVEADTYFCPERQGTYFGSFYMKDMPAMGNSGFSIPDDLTANMGDSFIAALDTHQAALITGLVDSQKNALNGVVDARTAISTLLRQFMLDDNVDKAAVLDLAASYGSYDGEIIYQYATSFSTVGAGLSDAQQLQINAIRAEWNNIPCNGVFLYSVNIQMPEIIDTDFFFGIADENDATQSTNSLIADSAELNQIANGFQFAEGPAADNQGNLYFSDITAHRIYHWSESAGLSVFKGDSGGANGLFITPDKQLLAAEGGNKRLVNIVDKAQVKVLAEQFNSLPFNEPNDLWVATDGGIYFTDPAFTQDQTQDGEHVYYYSSQEQSWIRVADDLQRPNGIVGTADGKTLYITDYGAGKTYRYRINSDGSLADKSLFADVGGDGMTIDRQGNLYISEQRVLVYNVDGDLIQTIATPEAPTNLTFGGSDAKTLFITTKTALYSLAMKVSGVVYDAVEWQQSIDPIPDITVNAMDNPGVISQSSPITIQVRLSAGALKGQAVDCWIWAETPMGIYSYVYPQGWKAGLYPAMGVVTTAIMDISSPFTVMDKGILPRGNYQLQFAIDENADGHLDVTWADTIQMTIE